MDRFFERRVESSINWVASMAFTLAKALLRSSISPYNNLSNLSAMAIIRAPIRDSLSFQSIRKSSAVIPFMMVPDKNAETPEVFDAVDRSLSSHRVFDVFRHFRPGKVRRCSLLKQYPGYRSCRYHGSCEAVRNHFYFRFRQPHGSCHSCRQDSDIV